MKGPVGYAGTFVNVGYEGLRGVDSQGFEGPLSGGVSGLLGLWLRKGRVGFVCSW